MAARERWIIARRAASVNKLNSKARPNIFTRSYRTNQEDYDAVNVGWKVRVLDTSPTANLPAHVGAAKSMTRRNPASAMPATHLAMT